VALTRAKNKVWLVTLKNNESDFITELKSRYDKEIQYEKFTCPNCGGNLIKHSGPYGFFWGCSNYKKTGCKYIRKI
jgi:DNA helicase-4